MPRERFQDTELRHFVYRPFEPIDEHILQGLAGLTPEKELYRVSTLVPILRTDTSIMITIQEASMDTERAIRDYLFHQGKKGGINEIPIACVHQFVPKKDVSGNHKNHPLLTACATIHMTFHGGDYKSNALFVVGSRTFTLVQGRKIKPTEDIYRITFREIVENKVKDSNLIAVNPFIGEDIRDAMILIQN